MVQDAYAGSDSYLKSLAATWEENALFFLGDQHIYWDSASERFENTGKGLSSRLPQPTENHIFPIIQTISSLMTRQKPTATSSPNSTDRDDVNAARTSELILDYLWELNDMQRKSVLWSIMAPLWGTSIRKTYWDASRGPIGQNGAPLGDVAEDVLDPFRLIPDIVSGSWFMETNIKPVTWIRQAFDPANAQGDWAQGLTGKAAEVQEDTALSYPLRVWHRLRTFSYGEGSNLYTGGYDARYMKGHAVLKELYVQPTPNHPNGQLLITANDKVLYYGDSPYYDPKHPDSWHPYSFFKYQEAAFRWHGIDLGSQLVPNQRRINSILTMVMLVRGMCAMPQLLIPDGTKIPEGYWTGAPGLQIRWDPKHSNNVPPQRLEGSSAAQQVFVEYKDALENMYRISGTNEVLAGQRPAGVNTATALQLLQEQSYDKFNPLIQNWEKFHEVGARKALLIVQKRYVEPRPEMVARIKALHRELLDVEIASFKGADLRDNVNIKIEAGSSIPRSKAAERALYQEMAQAGMFGPIDPMQNPIGNSEFLEKFGIKSIYTPNDADVQRAQWANSVLLAISRGEMGQAAIQEIALRPGIDNAKVHEQVLTNFMKKPSFKDPLGLFQKRLQAIQMLIQQEQQQMQAQAMQAQMMQQPGMEAAMPPGEELAAPPEPAASSPRGAAPMVPPSDLGIQEGMPLQ